MFLQPNESDEAYYKRLGSKPNEASNLYSGRMGGIFALYVAICSADASVPFSTSHQPTFGTSSSAFGSFDQHHPPAHSAAAAQPPSHLLLPPYLSLGALWTWGARATCTPLSGHWLSPTFWATWAEVGGHALGVYGRQCTKLVHLLCRSVQHKVPSWAQDSAGSDARAATARLGLVLNGYHHHQGRFDPPEGAQIQP